MATDVTKLIGKSIESAEVLQFLGELGVKPKIEKDVDQIMYVIKRAGAAFIAEPRTKRIDTVFLHSEKERGFTAYKGTLPNGVSFSMTVDGLKKLLGKPDLIHRTKNEHLMNWEFDDYKLSISFDPKDAISTVTVSGA